MLPPRPSWRWCWAGFPSRCSCSACCCSTGGRWRRSSMMAGSCPSACTWLSIQISMHSCRPGGAPLYCRRIAAVLPLLYCCSTADDGLAAATGVVPGPSCWFQAAAGACLSRLEAALDLSPLEAFTHDVHPTSLCYVQPRCARCGLPGGGAAHLLTQQQQGTAGSTAGSTAAGTRQRDTGPVGMFACRLGGWTPVLSH